MASSLALIAHAVGTSTGGEAGGAAAAAQAEAEALAREVSVRQQKLEFARNNYNSAKADAIRDPNDELYAQALEVAREEYKKALEEYGGPSRGAQPAESETQAAEPRSVAV
jgi:hypothetical protein